MNSNYKVEKNIEINNKKTANEKIDDDDDFDAIFVSKKKEAVKK